MSDFGFVDDAYTALSIYQDAQECINWYVEIDPKKAGSTNSPAARGYKTLYPTYGLVAQLQLAVAEVRGLHVLPGGQTMIAVAGATVYSISSTFVQTVIGSLLTSSTPISMNDNGVSVYIVDGPNRYSYVIATGVFSVIADTDGAFTGGNTVVTVDNYFVYSRPGSNQFAASSPLSTVTPALSFGSKFGAPDFINGMIAQNREVWLLGEYESEIWIDIGTFPFAFQVIPGTTFQHGCASKNSIARLGQTFAFLAQDDRGTAIVAQAEGYAIKRISTFAVENDINFVGAVVNDAIGFTWQVKGHEFYVLTFPTQDKTWVYDGMTGFWHKWLAVDNQNVYHRHRAQCAASFQGKIIVGDYANGLLYYLDNTVFSDNGATIRRMRRCPHLVNDLKRVFQDQLQLQFQPGVGLITGQGSNPQAMLRWSDDGGSTWSNEHWVSIGKIGQYKNRAMWRRLGYARDRIYEVVITDPINAVIVSADLLGDEGAH